MRKFLFIFLFVLSIFPMFSINSANAYECQKFVVCANSATLFENYDFSSQKVAIFTHNDEIEIEIENNLPVKYLSNGFVFYKARFEDKIGFVLSDLVIEKTNQIETIPNFNAKTNNICKVYFKNDLDFVESEIILEKHQKIFLYEGYNKNNQFTAISFLNNNQVLFGYVKTENVDPDGINPILITCISIILAVIGIVFAWVFIKNKKVKLKQKKLA